jgi:hypothetical protein
MEEFEELGATLYAESGQLYKLIGVLRAADMFWNPDKKYEYNITTIYIYLS